MKYKDYFSILEYYRKVVQPTNRKYHTKGDKLMVCPLHNDHDPSIGIVLGKDGDELFHCFGCGQWGNIVDLHVRVSKRLFNKYLSDEDALKDLCRIFNVDYDKLPKEDLNKDINIGVRQELALEKSIEKFDISDFKSMLMEGKLKGKGVGYFNTVLMIMIDSCRD